MGKYAVVVVGPAGSGKSTFCKVLNEHYSIMKRSTHICNFDPAAEDLVYEPSIDIRELVSLEDVSEAKGLGPNGGLVYCMEYLMDNVAWINDEIKDYSDDFLIVDMPGQIELLSHIPVVPAFIDVLRTAGYFVSAAFLLDAPTVTSDPGKYISGCLLALTTLMSLECPFVSILSKCDMLPESTRASTVLSHFENCEFDYLDARGLPPRFRAMSRQIATIVTDFSMLRFVPLNITDEDTVHYVASILDDTLQVDEDADVRDTYDEGCERED